MHQFTQLMQDYRVIAAGASTSLVSMPAAYVSTGSVVDTPCMRVRRCFGQGSLTRDKVTQGAD